MIRTIRFLIQQIQTSGNFNEIEKKEMEKILTSMPRHFYIGRSQLLMAWGVVETFKKRNRRKKFSITPPQEISEKELARAVWHFQRIKRHPEKYEKGDSISNSEIVRLELKDIFRDILRKRQIHESRLDAWLYVCKLIEDWIDTTDDIPAESIAATIVFYELSQSPKGVSHARVEQLTSVPMNVFTIHSRIIREQIFEKIAEEE
tara:strand:+ start:814 stop:1425 length:612 start_codon:yes stop_codon:yes gene_type:complete